MINPKTSALREAISNKDGVCYVVGGGASLKDFDFSWLRGRPCILANKAAFFVPDGFLVSIDRDFCFNFQREIALFGDRALLAPPDNLPQVEGAIYLKRNKYRSVFDCPPDELAGLNSGFAALECAIHAGFQNIALLGVDMIPNGGHFHDGYKWGSNQVSGLLNAWIEDFDRAGEECFERKINVINFSPMSAVTGFEKRPLSELKQFERV